MARPRVLFVSRTRYWLPLDPRLARKFDALRERLDVRVLATSADGRPRHDPVFELAGTSLLRPLDGALFYLTLPVRVARELRRFGPDAVIAQSAYEAFGTLAGRALARSRARLVLEVHGDWRTSTRLYGSPLRRVLGPLGDRVAAAAVRRADAVRTVSAYTTGLVRSCGVEPTVSFPAYVDADELLRRPPVPLPALPQLLFVGVLERYKNVDGLVAAWRLAAPRLPGVRLRIVGKGGETALVERLCADLPGQTRWDRQLSFAEVCEALDESSALVLPSRSEGLPRIVLEAFARRRPVIASAAAGLVDIVEDGVNGVHVHGLGPEALAAAIVGTLSDRPLLEALSAGTEAACSRWLVGPDVYAERVRALVEGEPVRARPLRDRPVR